ncbi:MAG: hypothetical protein OCD76_10530 [Reichenbachiella sp.]
MKRYFTFLIFFYSSLFSREGFLEAKDRGDGLVVIEQLQYLVEPTEKLTVDNVVALLQNEAFNQVGESNVANFSIDEPVVWFSFHINSLEDHVQYLSPGNEATLWEATLYVSDANGQYKEMFDFDHLTGMTEAGSLNFSTVAIELPQGKEDFLLRVFARQNRSYRLLIGDLYSMTGYLNFKDSIALAFIGFLTCIFIYVLYSFLVTRSKVFLVYLTYLIFVVYVITFHCGYVLAGNKYMWQGEMGYGLIMSGFYLLSAWFAIIYLKLKVHAPKMRKWIIGLATTLVVGGLVIDFWHLMHIEILSKGMSSMILLLNISMWMSGVYVWSKGVRYARFYVLGWLFVFISMMIFIFSSYDLIRYDYYIDFALYLGFALEAILFAFALGDQLDILRREKRSLELSHLDIISEKNRLLAKQLYMNSHLFRGPLTRVLGLLGLIKLEDSKAERTKLVQHAENSTTEMDVMSQKMSKMLENEGYLNEYQDDFDKVQKDTY